MLTLSTRLKNLVFVIIGAVAIVYIGLNYADVGRYVGYTGYYTVQVELPETGGLLTNADVTYRGVSVGRVGPLHLTGDGLRADLHIRNSAPRIPEHTQAVVASLSAVGEVYIDLRPSASGGPYLADHSLIPRTATQTPTPVSDLLASLNSMAGSIPLDSLRTVVDELGTAFNGEGPNLQALLDNGHAFVLTADQHADSTNTFVIDADTVLKTQNAESQALLDFSHNAELIGAKLRSSDPALRKLIAATPPAAEEVNQLLKQTNPSFSIVLANLLTTSELSLTRVDGLEELLVKIPQAVAVGNTVASKDKGTLQFGMATTFFNPLPCTKGYSGTKYRNGLDTSAGPALNTAARCLMPGSSGVDVRGSNNVPKGGVPAAVQPGSVALSNPSTAGLPGALGLPGTSSGPTDLAGLLGLPAASANGGW